ncbi:MAG: uracil-DNA glycosylase [Xanthomonadaceae bacterium]|nr:uracil-DNA glycosylase [Xanthomonadaceae bacterium]
MSAIQRSKLNDGFLPKGAIVMAKKSKRSKPKNLPATVSTDGLPNDFESLQADVANCKKCKLCETRHQTVFSDGSNKAKLMFIGEAPGEQEDETGKPFVGRAGQLLTKMIEAMGLTRNEIYIANIIKCRPPENRYPETEEVIQCQPYLMKQIELLKPTVIVALGTCATQTLLRTEETISDMRGKYVTFDTGKFKTEHFMPTFHPSFLLRSPQGKKQVWKDLQVVAKTMGIKIPHQKSV